MALTPEEIKTVQRWLATLLGLPTLPVTGRMDAATSNAVRDWKTAVGIMPVDDDLENLSTWSTLCDAATWELLDDDVHGPSRF
jgi:peptidoglycan hydrolase-like protein with peptidoglycan-binding domain